MSFFDDVPMPENFTKLPTGGTFTMASPIRVDARDLQRFIEAGGTIDQAGFRLFISDPTRIIAANVARMAGTDPDSSGDTMVKPSAGSCTLKAGDVVYRVVEIDPPPDAAELHTWKIASAVVERASERQVKLKTRLLGLANLVFEPSAFGRLFHESPLQAIQHFLTARRLEVESLDRRRKEAERAIAWATSQEGMS
jgi:hypothetical protein